MHTRKNVDNCKLHTISFLFCLFVALLSACSDAYAFKTNWGIDFPNSYFSGKKCIVDIGTDYIKIIECQNVSQTEIEKYAFTPVDESARIAYKEIQDFVNERNKRVIEENGEPIYNLSLLSEIDENWNELSCFMVRKTEADYCILLYDSVSNVLYICECS